MRKKRPILQMAEQYRLASENAATAAQNQVQIEDQAPEAKPITKNEEVEKLVEKSREEVANDYVQNLYEAVAQTAPKQEGEGVINYETQAREDNDLQIETRDQFDAKIQYENMVKNASTTRLSNKQLRSPSMQARALLSSKSPKLSAKAIMAMASPHSNKG